MKVMVLVKANKDSEGGKLPDEQILSAMAKFNDELAKAGVLLDLNGLKPSKDAVRIRFDGPKGRTVIDGPFAETKELVAGYWVLQVKSKEEAIEWMKRSPFQEGEIELRPIFELTDFEMTPETRAAHENVGAKLQKGA